MFSSSLLPARVLRLLQKLQAIIVTFLLVCSVCPPEPRLASKRSCRLMIINAVCLLNVPRSDSGYRSALALISPQEKPPSTKAVFMDCSLAGLSEHVAVNLLQRQCVCGPAVRVKGMRFKPKSNTAGSSFWPFWTVLPSVFGNGIQDSSVQCII